jgi:hypothetical protein
MSKILKMILMIPCFFGLLGCGGSPDSSVSNNFSSSEDSGPLAGVWIGSANGVMHTITIDGQGNTYLASWDTSNECFTSESGTTVHFDSNIEILCSGYDDNQQSYIFLSIYGEYDGENTIEGQIHAEECGTDDEHIILSRSVN